MPGFAVYTTAPRSTDLDPTSAIIQTLVDTIKRDSFVSDYKATDAEGFGLLMARYFEHDQRILEAAAYALEDANFHTQSGEVKAMHEAIERAGDDSPIEDDMRKALLARLGEVYGRDITSEKRRADRLSILSTLAGTPILSVSRRGNMTVGDFRRVMKVLDTLSK